MGEERKKSCKLYFRVGDQEIKLSKGQIKILLKSMRSMKTFCTEMQAFLNSKAQIEKQKVNQYPKHIKTFAYASVCTYIHVCASLHVI